VDRERPFDPESWTGALILMAGFAAVLWIVQILNAIDDYRLDRFGLKPREFDGLWGVVTMPFLHSSYGHLLSNTIPVILIGWVVLLAGLSTWATVTGLVVVGGGVLTWLVGPGDSVIVGASGLVFGWLGYLLARAYFSRRLKWIVVAVLVLVFFGTLLFGLFPSINSDVSWQAHVCGFVAGIGTGALLHPRGQETRLLGRSAVS
jgi:membrane associated rhomboid family serine protease